MRTAFTTVVLLLAATTAARGEAPTPRAAGLVEKARAARASGGLEAIPSLAALDRFATFEAVDWLLRQGVPGDGAVARGLATGYARAFGDESLGQRVATFESFTPEERRHFSEAMRTKDGGKGLFAEGRLDEAHAAFAAALEVFQVLRDPEEEARCRTSLGAVAAIRGESREALEHLDAARLAARRAGDLNLLGPIELNRSYALADLARFDEALQALDAAEAAARSTSDVEVELAVVVNRGTILENVGRLAEAGDAFRRAASAAASAGNVELEAEAWYNLSAVAQSSGDTRLERDTLGRALSLAERAKLRSLEARAHVSFARLARRQGRWAEDRRHLDAARRIMSAMDDPQSLADVELNEGLHRIARGRFSEALPFLDAAARRLEGLDAQALASSVEGARSVALYYSGEYALAEATLRDALSRAQAAGHVALEAERRAGLGFILFNLGQAAEGLAEVERAARIHEAVGDTSRWAYDLNVLGVLRFRAGDLNGARVALEQALAGFDRERDPTSYAEAQKDLGMLDLAQGRHADGRRRLRGARDVFQGVGDPLGVLDVSLLEAEGAIGDNDLAEARVCLERATAAAGRTSTREYAWKAHYLRGRLAGADRAAAARWYRRSIEEVERTREGTGRAIGRAAILEDRLVPYRALSDLLLEDGEIATSWQVARAGKARSFLESIAPPPLELGFGELSEVVPQVGGERPPRAPASIPSDRLLALLREGEVLLDFFVEEGRIRAYVARRDRLTTRILEFGSDRAGLLDAARWPGRPVREDEAVTAAWRAAMKSLGTTILAPFEADLLAARSVLVVPNGPLHGIPFGALEAGGQRLSERVEVTVLPAAEALLSRGRASRGRGLLAWGDPATATALPRLPAAAEEARAVATRTPGARAIVGAEATEALFRKLAPRAARIHVAAHGRVDRAAPSRSHLLLAPGGGDDGRLEAGEIAELKLAAALVVLSGCATAVEGGLARSEAPGDDRFGLPRAFLAAGAGSVVAGLWEMEDVAGREMMPHLYGFLGDRGAATAVAALQRALTDPDRPAELRELGHPYYWAGLVAYGAGLGFATSSTQTSK